MGERSLIILYAILTFLLHLKPAIGFTSRVGDDSVMCIERERQALLEFKEGLVDHHGRLSSWGSEDEKKNCCNWEGVHCSNQTGRVLELHLNAYQIDGFQRLLGMNISPSLLELHHLTFLDLGGNDFNESPIPKFIGSLSNLKYLDLSWANLSGPVPHQLENLSHLQYLNLGWNDLKIIENLEWLSRLSSIEYLDLSSTNLSNVANDWLEVVSHLPNLTSLRMLWCDPPPMSLSAFSYFNYSKSFAPLEILDLCHNQLVHIPKSFGDICTLRELYLSSNNLNGQLVELMNNLSGCAKNSLEVLDLSLNQITGSFPNFAIFPSLKDINLSHNKLNGTLPRSIGNLYKLEVLSVSSNFLHGVISESHFSNLSKLQSLFLFNNSLSLEFNFNWVPPFQLDVMYLTSCNLGPRFPNWIRTQRKLSFLDISNANISDTILDEWLEDLPPTIRVLNLSSNQIHGWLPNVSAKRLNGLAIDLSANRIEGPLPLFPTNLTILKLSKNRFSGSISSLCKISGQLLTLLDLSHNILSGQLPNCFMHWHKLIILDLAGNNFFGEVPSSLGSLSQLQTLRLNDNNFSGHLPSSLRNCSSLTIMDLGNNRFSGKVPAWIGEGLPRLIFLLLGSNKFYGSIPLHLCWLKHLQILDLCLNDISGTIPQCINNFTAMAQKEKFSIDIVVTIIHGNNLAYLHKYVYSAMFVLKRKEYVYSNNLGLLKIINLSSNKLSGKLPSEISGLLELVVLNVSRNNLIGEIPQMIGQLKQLESLDLSRNQFSGEIPFSMSDLNFLSDLDLSYNNLFGKIPSSTQLQSLNANDFIGNAALCGPPLKQKCPGEETPNQSEATIKDNEENGDKFRKWFYFGMDFGFPLGFWSVSCSLLLKRSWRHAYFLLLDNTKDWLYVTMTVNMARLWRKFQRHG